MCQQPLGNMHLRSSEGGLTLLTTYVGAKELTHQEKKGGVRGVLKAEMQALCLSFESSFACLFV